MKNILVCGDSYNDMDSRYPGLHWVERLDSYNVYNISRGACSNFSIWHQVMQAPQLEADMVFIAFTAVPRVEFPRSDKVALPDYSTLENNEYPPYIDDKKWHYRNSMWETINHCTPSVNKDQFLKWMPFYIPEFEILKNFLYIKSALDFLKKQNIPYYFTLGGFEADMESNPIIDFEDHLQYNILPNGWHVDWRKDLPPGAPTDDPYFHIRDPQWHADHAELVKSLLK
jgi:hypothetical protein